MTHLAGAALFVGLALVPGQCALGSKLQTTSNPPAPPPPLPPAGQPCSPTEYCFPGGSPCVPCKLPTGVCEFNWFKPDSDSQILDLGVVVVPPGTTCSWHWVEEDASHCVTPAFDNPPDWKGKGAGSDQISSAGYVYNHTFLTEGTYKYKCCTHLAGMKGIVVVSKNAPSSSPPPKPLTSPPPKPLKSPPPKPPTSPPPKRPKSPPPKPLKPPPPKPLKSPPPKPFKSPPPKPLRSPPPKPPTRVKKSFSP